MRKQKLWPTLLSGGQIEFILEGLLDANSFKTPERQALWQYNWHARSFLEELPFWQMHPADQLAKGAPALNVGVGRGKTSPLPAQVFALPGEIYAVYLPIASPAGELNLTTAPGRFSKRWYNPRTGIFASETEYISGGSWVELGQPPADPAEDWAILLRREPIAEFPAKPVFPAKSWETREPQSLGLDPAKLDALAASLGGRGCIVKDGYIVKSWGDQHERSDIFSSAKPILSTLLLFALKEAKIQSVDQPIADFGWPLPPKDQPITLRHLASMTSGYARPEPPGEAWAYNDYAINLYQKTLFDKIFKADPEQVANHPDRLGALGLEDHLAFRPSNRRISASVADLARIAWFWRHRGEWNGAQILPREYFTLYCRPQVPKDLPLTAQAQTDDRLNIGTYGGESDHFSKAGPGVYGFNWWFNATGRDHPDRLTWPDAPPDTFLAIGARGNNAAIIPSLNAVLVALNANWGDLNPQRTDSPLNQTLKSFAKAVARSTQKPN
jgi:CubicO group peptidase (beta-lactamase class C family)